MIRTSTIIFIVLKLAKNQDIDVIPEPPAELTNIPPPPEDIEVEAINFEDLRSANETETPKALETCSDSSQYCAYWQQNWGCSHGGVAANCKKACNSCGSGTCSDSNEDPWKQYCSTWKSYCSSQQIVKKLAIHVVLERVLIVMRIH